MCLFNEQRTGKTPTSIMCMHERGVQRLLIVCPASMMYKWKEEYETWTGKVATVIDSAAKFRKEPPAATDAWIINYENLRSSKTTTGIYEKILSVYKPDGLIVDEAHRCKDRNSYNFKAINELRSIENRLYLTGTPAPNKPEEIYYALHFVAPEIYRGFWKFAEEYFNVGMESFSQYAPAVRVVTGFKPGAEEKLQEVLNKYAIMRKRKDVMPWLPKEEAPTIIRLECTPRQRKAIKELEEDFETEHIVCQGILDRIVRIRQICGAPEVLGLKTNSPKIDWLEQYVKDYPEKSIIVFSNSRKLLEVVESKLRFKILTGLTPPKDRQALINAFQGGTIKVLCIQTQAGKEGLTLDKADVTIFLDTYPPAADYQQAKDRMVPVSEDRVKPKEIIHLMMKGTYDEQLYKLVEHNIGVTAVINDYINYIKERRQSIGTNN